MRPPNQPNPAPRKRINRPLLALPSLLLIYLSGCSGGIPSAARITDFLTGSTPIESPTPTATLSPTPAPTPAPTPQAEETRKPESRKTATQAHAPAENATPASKTTSGIAAVSEAPTLSSPDADPARAQKLIEDLDKIEKRVDRNDLSSDDSQRDILAQKLLQQARTALAGHDNAAAMSLATKASTLLAPLPKLADPDIHATP
jgi:hypothetical protein